MIPNTYQSNNSNEYNPKFKIGRNHSFYCNADQLFAGSTEGWRLDLYDGSGLVESDVATLVQNTINNGFKWYTQNLYMNPNDKNALHYLALVNGKAWDLRSAAYASKSLTTSSQETTTTDIDFNPDGTKAFVIGLDNNAIFQYSLSPIDRD